MQKIFHNAKIYMIDKKEPCAEAFFVNDGVIVFVGSNEEVLQMKQDDTKLVDLENKLVVPTFFDSNARVYELIENELKNANNEKYIENNDEIDENYEKFCNFDKYKQIFLKLQDEYLNNGISTIQEMGISAKEFIFWKKLSEQDLLKIDVIAYVDLLSSKQVMDDNCRSYRKYKKHFRLGGYYLAIDGDITQKKAYLNRPYKKEHGYKGYTVLQDEQLHYLFKTALEEKKQLVVETNGDNAVEQFLRCFEGVIKEQKIEDKFRPIALKCNILSSKHLKKMKELEIIPSFEVSDLVENSKELKALLGGSRANKIQPIKNAKILELDFILNTKSNSVPNAFSLASIASLRNNKNILGAKQKISFFEAMMSLTKTSSYVCFDQEQKGSIENGKVANFLVCDNIFEMEESLASQAKIYDVFLMGENVKK